MVNVIEPTKNILYFSSFGDMRGGGQESLFQLIEHLDKNKFRPFVVVPNDGDLVARLKSINVIVIIIGLPKVTGFNVWTSGKAVKKLIDTIKTYNIDLIHTDGPRNTFYGGLAAKIKCKPLIWHIRISEKDKYDRLLYFLSSRIVLVANTLRTRFAWVSNSDKFITVYNGVDLSEPRLGKFVPLVREQYGIDRKTLLIAAIARIESLKGQRYLIEACGRLRDKLDDVCVLLIGDIVDSGYCNECKALARELGIENRLIFAGYQNNIDQFLSEIDLFVLPSLSEAFPRSVIEAMGAGKPVIVTDVGGCSEAVEDKVSGFVVPAMDSKALADAIHKLCKDSKLRSKFGQAARVRAEKMFGIMKNVKQTEQVYLNILGKD